MVVSDTDTGNPVPGAEVGIDAETGEYDPPGPTWKGVTDAGGRVRLVHGFVANAVIGKDGKVRGLVVFNRGTSSLSFSDLLLVRAAGYRGETISLSRGFPRGVPYEDKSPRTVQVQLSPSPAECPGSPSGVPGEDRGGHTNPPPKVWSVTPPAPKVAPNAVFGNEVIEVPGTARRSC